MNRIFVTIALLIAAAAQAQTPADAAKAAALSKTNACSVIGDFYWEIGNGAGKRASGQRGTTYTASTRINIASASKWGYGAYVAQTKTLTPADIQSLRMGAGYNDTFGKCEQRATVKGCATATPNGTLTPASVGKFAYGGGDMQVHAASGPLASDRVAALGADIGAALGINLKYSQPLLAGGAVTTAADYRVFLRKMMSNQLAIGALLGSNSVCTNPATCPAALHSPIPPSAGDWRYSLGHWVEADGTFSSAGAFGFYPWISADKAIYGILARASVQGAQPGEGGAGYASQKCGKLIRDAYRTGVAS